MKFLFLICFIMPINTIPLIADTQGGRQNNALEIDGISLKDSMLDHASLSVVKEAIRDTKISYPKSSKIL